MKTQFKQVAHNMKSIYLGVLLAALLGLSFSSISSAATGWTPLSTVEQIYPYSNGNVFIRLQTPPTYTGCSNNGYVLLLTTLDGFDVMFATALAAHHAQNGIQIFLLEGNCSGADGAGYYPLVTHLRTFK